MFKGTDNVRKSSLKTLFAMLPPMLTYFCNYVTEFRRETISILTDLQEAETTCITFMSSNFLSCYGYKLKSIVVSFLFHSPREKIVFFHSSCFWRQIAVSSHFVFCVMGSIFCSWVWIPSILWEILLLRLTISWNFKNNVL